MFLIDTNVLSQAKKDKRTANIQKWIESQYQIAIPFPAILEIQQGIIELAKISPHRAADLQQWLDAVLRSDFIYPPITQEVALKLAELHCCGPLKTLWYPRGPRKKPGQDLFIAAISIVYGMPIATLDMMDFVTIDQYFPLPGVYNPAFDAWLVPGPGQRNGEAADVQTASG